MKFKTWLQCTITALLIAALLFSHQPATATFFGTGVPAGVMMPYWSSDTVAPVGWHLCDGSTVTWLTGPHAGASVTLPNTIGTFIEGSDIQGGSATANASGFGHIVNQSTGGTITHRHTMPIEEGLPGSESIDKFLTSNNTGFTSTEPYRIGAPYIIKL
jgi:hypothetical protein